MAAGKIRVLLVLCRPGRQADVPFRSVASHLVRLSRTAREILEVDVLRPPTFAHLVQVLEAARQQHDAYQVVHFDGHGVYADVGAGVGRRGYLLFEDPGVADNLTYVDGHMLGQLLADTGVPLLVLNACRSAYTDVCTEPQEPGRDTEQRVRAYGSLAEEVVRAGVSGVVAMRYNIYVVTAAQFTGDLYAALAAGQTLGEAATAARSKLASQPYREIAFPPRPLQDWVVPVVYETAPLRLPAMARPVRAITLDQAEAAEGRSCIDPGLPADPEAGFYGRDETLLGLERAFDDRQIVLLHGWAGAGKTSTAVEFARWYKLTGGLDHGHVLFTSFARYTPLARLLDQVGALFGQWIQATGVQWLALPDAERRTRILAMLAQVPVLWIWDNVEPVAGFPAGIASAWPDDEQRELVGFLRELRRTKAKVLLTSRRDERDWLGDMPVRTMLPPMPMSQRLQLAHAIAVKRGRQLIDIAGWQPLLEFTQGNPLTVAVLTGQALRYGLRSKEQAETFVAQLRTGAAGISDDLAQGRDKSLASSLGYGFRNAFDSRERALLALLHLFEGFVDVDVLLWMADPAAGHYVSRVRGLTVEEVTGVLDRGVEIGMLTAVAEGAYGIHPALPWYLRQLFTECYGAGRQRTALMAIRAYAAAIGQLGDYYSGQYGDGRAGVIGWLGREEGNLRRACDLARSHGWVEPMIGAMEGLSALYQHTGRLSEWKRLVDAFPLRRIQTPAGQALPGREEQWAAVTGYRVGVARETLDWAEGERLQQALVSWRREQAASALAAPGTPLAEDQRDALGALAVSVEHYGHLLRDQGKATCVAYYQEALALHRRTGDRQAEGIVAFNLGRAYVEIAGLRDLDEARGWYQLSLDLCPKTDRLGRARSVGQLGSLAYERFKELSDAGAPRERFLPYLTEAATAYQRALDLMPGDAASDISVIRFQLGAIDTEAGDIDSALEHYRESARYGDILADPYAAGQTRFNIAFALAWAGRFQDAALYAQAALHDFERVGPGAGDLTRRARELIARIVQSSRADSSEARNDK